MLYCWLNFVAAVLIFMYHWDAGMLGEPLRCPQPAEALMMNQHIGRLLHAVSRPLLLGAEREGQGRPGRERAEER